MANVQDALQPNGTSIQLLAHTVLPGRPHCKLADTGRHTSQAQHSTTSCPLGPLRCTEVVPEVAMAMPEPSVGKQRSDEVDRLVAWGYQSLGEDGTRCIDCT